MVLCGRPVFDPEAQTRSEPAERESRPPLDLKVKALNLQDIRPQLPLPFVDTRGYSLIAT